MPEKDNLVGSAAIAQRYYEKIEIDPILTKILKQLGKNLPEKPITFMIELLREEGIKRKEFTAETGPFFRAGSVAADDEVSEQIDDNESLPGSLSGPSNVAPPPAAMYARRRRENVFAEQVEEEEDWQAPVYEKSEAEKAFIRKSLRANALFGTPENGQTAEEDLLINACFSREFTQGDIAIRQGDEGNEWFILAEGEALCYVRTAQFDATKDDPDFGKQVLCYRPGMTFGELALMYNAPRAATIRVSSPTAKAWVLDRKTFKQTLMKAQNNLRNEQMQGVQTFPMFEYLTKYEQIRIADALEVRNFAQGERIIQEGSDGVEFYLLVDGSCRCVKKDDATGEEKDCFRILSTGDFFGEISLLKKSPCAASVDAITDVKCFALPKESFLRLIGPLDDVLRRNMDTYLVWEKQYGLKAMSPGNRILGEAELREEDERVRALPTSSADSPTRVPLPSQNGRRTFTSNEEGFNGLPAAADSDVEEEDDDEAQKN